MPRINQQPTPNVPEGMVDLLKGLARDVLREKPDNIYEFAAEYFENLLCERDGSLDKGYEKFREYDRRMAELRRSKESGNNLQENSEETKQKNGKVLGKQHVPPVDMGVNGVAMQVNPRENKLKRQPSNRRKRYGESRSTSQDYSDMEETEEKQPTIDEGEADVDAVIEESEVGIDDESGGMISPLKRRNLSSGKPSQGLIAIKEEAPYDEDEAKIERKVEQKRTFSEDQAAFIIQSAIRHYVTKKKESIVEAETPTNDDFTENASLSEATTVIENTDSQTPLADIRDDLSSGITSEQEFLIEEANSMDTIVVTDPDVVADGEQHDRYRVTELQKMDRLRTPESDSGLSEKSFNMKIQESAHENSVEQANIERRFIGINATEANRQEIPLELSSEDLPTDAKSELIDIGSEQLNETEIMNEVNLIESKCADMNTNSISENDLSEIADHKLSVIDQKQLCKVESANGVQTAPITSSAAEQPVSVSATTEAIDKSDDALLIRSALNKDKGVSENNNDNNMNMDDSSIEPNNAKDKGAGEIINDNSNNTHVDSNIENKVSVGHITPTGVAENIPEESIGEIQVNNSNNKTKHESSESILDEINEKINQHKEKHSIDVPGDKPISGHEKKKNADATEIEKSTLHEVTTDDEAEIQKVAETSESTVNDRKSSADRQHIDQATIADSMYTHHDPQSEEFVVKNISFNETESSRNIIEPNITPEDPETFNDVTTRVEEQIIRSADETVDTDAEILVDNFLGDEKVSEDYVDDSEKLYINDNNGSKENANQPADDATHNNEKIEVQNVIHNSDANADAKLTNALKTNDVTSDGNDSAAERNDIKTVNGEHLDVDQTAGREENIDNSNEQTTHNQIAGLIDNNETQMNEFEGNGTSVDILPSAPEESHIAVSEGTVDHSISTDHEEVTEDHFTDNAKNTEEYIDKKSANNDVLTDSKVKNVLLLSQESVTNDDMEVKETEKLSNENELPRPPNAESSVSDVNAVQDDNKITSKNVQTQDVPGQAKVESHVSEVVNVYQDDIKITNESVRIQDVTGRPNEELSVSNDLNVVQDSPKNLIESVLVHEFPGQSNVESSVSDIVDHDVNKITSESIQGQELREKSNDDSSPSDDVNVIQVPPELTNDESSVTVVQDFNKMTNESVQEEVSGQPNVESALSDDLSEVQDSNKKTHESVQVQDSSRVHNNESSASDGINVNQDLNKMTNESVQVKKLPSQPSVALNDVNDTETVTNRSIQVEGLPSNHHVESDADVDQDANESVEDEESPKSLSNTNKMTEYPLQESAEVVPIEVAEPEIIAKNVSLLGPQLTDIRATDGTDGEDSTHDANEAKINVISDSLTSESNVLTSADLTKNVTVTPGEFIDPKKIEEHVRANESTQENIGRSVMEGNDEVIRLSTNLDSIDNQLSEDDQTKKLPAEKPSDVIADELAALGDVTFQMANEKSETVMPVDNCAVVGNQTDNIGIENNEYDSDGHKEKNVLSCNTGSTDEVNNAEDKSFSSTQTQLMSTLETSEIKSADAPLEDQITDHTNHSRDKEAKDLSSNHYIGNHSGEQKDNVESNLKSVGDKNDNDTFAVASNKEISDASSTIENDEKDEISDVETIVQPDSLDILDDQSIDQTVTTDSLIDIKHELADDEEFHDSLYDLRGFESLRTEMNDDEILAVEKDADKDEIFKFESNFIHDQEPPGESLINAKDASNLESAILGDVVDSSYVNPNPKPKLELLAIDEPSKATEHLMYSIQEVDTPLTPLTPRPPQIPSAGSERMNTSVILSSGQGTELNKPDENIGQNDEVFVSDTETPVGKLISDEDTVNGSPKIEKYHAHAQSNIKFDSKDGMSLSIDIPSSDLSDSETEPNETIEPKYIESGVDETSRDERDEISEIENFDLSSCGEDSLEAMYYVLRKNEILLDKQQKLENDDHSNEQRPIFPEKSTEDLNAVVRAVSGKKHVKTSESMDSSSNDVVLKNVSIENDSLSAFLDSEWDVDEEAQLFEKKSAVGHDSNEEEFMNPIIASMRQNENLLHRMHAKALSMNDAIGLGESGRDSEENDTFTEMPIDGMRSGNIQRNIFASSTSEADSDYFESGEKSRKIVRDDFNISTALDHVPGSTDSESTIESAATKIQAGAKGSQIRKRNRRSTSVEKHSSIGNAAIDKSLDELVRQHEQYHIDDTFDEDMDEIEADVLGITEVKVEQRKVTVMTDISEADTGEEQYENIIVSRNYEEQRTDSMDVVIRDQFLLATPQPDEVGTAQRRMTLHRGDALQRNSTPEEAISRENSSKGDNENKSEEKQHVDDEPDMESSAVDEVGDTTEDGTATYAASTPSTQIKENQTKASRRSPRIRSLGPRQRSMPVQIEAQFLRVIPKHSRKRVKSASNDVKDRKESTFNFH